MRTLRPEEIQLLSETLAHLNGARLQNVLSSAKDLILEFWLKGDHYYLWFEDSSLRPYISFWAEKLPLNVSKKMTPLALFLKAHFLGKHLRHVSFYPEFGRVLKLHFDEDHHLEYRIFPHGPNVIATNLDKSISLHKPKPLQELPEIESASDDLRSVEEFSHEWLLGQMRVSPKGKAAPVTETSAKVFEKRVEKLKKAIQKVSEELERKDSGPWIEAGDWLKSHRTFNQLPIEYEIYVDRKRSVHWNVDHVFTKAKDLERKKEGTRKRVQELEAELKKLVAAGPDGVSIKPSKPGREHQLKDQVKGRTLVLDSEVKVMSGKTAKDNLSLLRQARGWDLWFHLKDIPSSHAVVFRPKNRKLSPAEEEKVVQWFFEQNFGQKIKNEIGNRYEVLVAECRFVRPIKGDRVGRVNYHNEKVMRFEVKGP